MKAIKRTVAALLATLMLATSTSFTLAAETYTDEEAVVVAKVNAAGIMTGTDKGFEPSKSLTRAEAAAIIVRMKGISESAVKATAGTTLFNDVAASHWASGYINQASNLGIVKGVSATEFAPDREVLISEFVTMAVRALGAGQLVDSEGTWPTNYVNFANENGILDDVNAIYTATATRLNAATIVANTLETSMWEKTGVKSNGEIEWSNKNEKTILGDTLNIVEGEIVVAKVSNNDHEVTEDTSNKKFTVSDDFDLSTIKVGTKYSVYAKVKNFGKASQSVDKILGFWIEDEDAEDFSKIVSLSATKIKVKANGNETEYDFANTYSIYKNEVKLTESTTPKLSELIAATSYDADMFGTLYLDEKGKVESVYLTQFDKYGVVKELTASTIKFESATDVIGSTAEPIKYDNEDNEYFLTKDGKGMKYSDLKEGDAIQWYTVALTSPNKKYVGEVITNTVEGKVTSTADKYIKIDKVKYDIVTALKDKANNGDEIVAYLNKANKIAMIEKIEEEAGDVALVSYIRPVAGKYTGLSDYEVKLLYTDGTTSDALIVDLEGMADEYIANATNKEWTPTGGSKVTEASSTSAKEAAARQELENIIADNTKAYIQDNTTKVITKAAANTTAGAGETKLGVYWEGALVEYEVNGSKVIFAPVDAKENLVDSASSLTVGSKVTYATATNKYYITDSTKVYKLKEDDEYGVKFEKVNASELDDINAAFTAYVIGYDEDSEEVDTFIFATLAGVKRTTEANFAFITEISNTKVGNKSAKDIDVLYLDGTKASYVYCPDEADNKSLNTSILKVGNVVDLVLNEDMILDASIPSEANKDKVYNTDQITNKYLYEVKDNRIVVTSGVGADSNSNGVYELSELTSKATIYTADEMLVLEKDGDKFIVRSLSDIEEFDAAVTGASNKYELVRTVEYEDDEDKNLIVLVYTVND